MPKISILTDQKLAHTKYLDFNESIYATDDSGKLKQWVWAQRPNNVHAVVVAATVADKIVLIKEFRIPLADYIYELPAGLIDPGESPEEAGRREFEEETGLAILDILSVSPLVYNSPGLSDEGCYILTAKATGTKNVNGDYIFKTDHGLSEDIEVLLFNRIEVENLMRTPNIKIGAKAYLILKHYVETGSF